MKISTAFIVTVLVTGCKTSGGSGLNDANGKANVATGEAPKSLSVSDFPEGTLLTLRPELLNIKSVLPGATSTISLKAQGVGGYPKVYCDFDVDRNINYERDLRMMGPIVVKKATYVGRDIYKDMSYEFAATFLNRESQTEFGDLLRVTKTGTATRSNGLECDEAATYSETVGSRTDSLDAGLLSCLFEIKIPLPPNRSNPPLECQIDGVEYSIDF